MKTTVEIPDTLFRQLKTKAARENTTMKALIQSALRGYLAGEKRPPKKFKLKDASVGGQGLQSGIEEGNWEQMRALIYEGHGG